MVNWFKYQRVQPTENYGFGAISRKRGKWKLYTARFFIVIFIVHFVWTMTSIQPESLKTTYTGFNQSALSDDVLFYIHMYHYLFALLVSICGAIIGKFIQCLCVFVEEYCHLRSRYDNSFCQLIKSCFQVFFTIVSAVGTVVLIFFTIFMKTAYGKLYDFHHIDHTIYWLTFITSVGVTMIANFLFGFKTLSAAELSEIHESSSTNVAQGLAWSYFTGYLRIILPKLDETIKKDERWKKEMESKNLPCKLFAIVPLNCMIPAKLGECPDKHKGIKFDSRLPTLYVDRAGVKDRPYVNSVYTIDDGKGHQYHAICEYVTIIDTLYQMSFYAEMSEKAREEQCRLLVRMLEELIYDDDCCRNGCKIVMLSGLSGDDQPLLRDVLIDKIRECNMDFGG